MVQSIVIICEDSPFGKNSVTESVRLATGLLAVGDIELCKVIFLEESVYFLDKKITPESIKVDSIDNIIRLIELSDLEIYVHDEALKTAGLEVKDLIQNENIKVVDMEIISKLILDAEMCFKY
jgi:sulfur relay (sulfurtransferase) DsrF/TusC family protein